MHRDVKQRAESSKKRKVEEHNRKTNVKPVNFHAGDFVLVRAAVSKGHKLQFIWTGPRRIVSVTSDLVYEVEDLLDSKRATVHARIPQLYRADMEGKAVDPKLRRPAEHTEATFQDVKELRRIRMKEDRIEIEVEWEGLPDEVDMTWELLSQFQEDLPELLTQFLKTAGSRKLKEETLSQCSSS